MRALLFFLAAILSASELPPLPKPLAEQIAKARTLPREKFADEMVRMIEGGRVADLGWQKALLREAFTAAREAREPHAWIAVEGLSLDTRESYRARARTVQMDRLELENRVLRLLGTVDRRAEVEWFREIPRPRVTPAACEDALVADTGAYAEMAALVAQAGFSSSDKEQSAHVQFLVSVLDGVTSPIELARFVESLASVELKPSEIAIVGGALEAKLASLAVDSRAFALRAEALAGALDFFAARARAEGLATDTLEIAFRRYAVNQMKGPRCKEDSAVRVRGFGMTPPLTEEEMRPSEEGGGLQAKEYYGTAEAKRLAEALNRLAFRETGVPYSSSERQSTEWRSRLAGLLREYRGWSPEGDATDVLHQRLAVLRRVLEMAPVGEERDRIYGMCAEALSAVSPAERGAEWEWEARALEAVWGGKT